MRDEEEDKEKKGRRGRGRGRGRGERSGFRSEEGSISYHRVIVSNTQYYWTCSHSFQPSLRTDGIGSRRTSYAGFVSCWSTKNPEPVAI